MAPSPHRSAMPSGSTIPWSGSRSASKTSTTCGAICATRSTRSRRQPARPNSGLWSDATVIKRRGLADTVGFAHLEQQMDVLMRRIDRQDAATLARALRDKGISAANRWRMAIAPHDDYAYVGYLYPLVLANIKAGTVIVFGVAHKARQLDLEDQLIFDSFTHWRGPYRDIAVSPLRERIMSKLPEGSYRVSDEMQSIEHSVEAKLPFLQYYNRAVRFVSILVPFMSYAR